MYPPGLDCQVLYETLAREWLYRYEQEQAAKSKQLKSVRPGSPRLLKGYFEARRQHSTSACQIGNFVRWFARELEVITGKYWTFDTQTLERWIESRKKTRP